MTVKLSPQKISRMFRLYFLGFSQATAAEKLGVNQATVSLYLNEFTTMVDEEGLEATSKEYGIMDIVKELHSLGAELKKSGLTAEDAKKGLKVAVVLENCGVPQASYKDAVQVFIKANNEGFLSAAVELHKIEESSGKSFQESVKQAASLQIQIQQADKELSATQEKIGSVKQALAELLQQKKDVENKLQQILKKVGVDLGRLEKVENLAVMLKHAGITDKELDWYIQRQNLLNKSDISIGMFVQILEVMKVPTAPDGGKSLLKKLTEFGSLDNTIIGLKHWRLKFYL
ncbi:hypothetical protein ACFLUF_00670 [Chloroflexota bacterium]